MVSTTYVRALSHSTKRFDRLKVHLNLESRSARYARYHCLSMTPPQQLRLKLLRSRRVSRLWKSRSSRCPTIPVAVLLMSSPLRRGMPRSPSMFRLASMHMTIPVCVCE